MIDRRQIKVFEHDVDEGLQDITDTSILLNFQQVLVSLYPHLIPIQAFAYEAWDDIVEPLLYEMVYKTFSFKYGMTIHENDVYKHMYGLSCYKGINHIECIPKHHTFKALVNFEWVEMDKNDLEDEVFVFKTFGDGEHFLSTGGIPKEKAYNVTFNLVEVDLVSTKTSFPSKKSIFINKDEVDFEFVVET